MYQIKNFKKYPKMSYFVFFLVKDDISKIICICFYSSVFLQAIFSQSFTSTRQNIEISNVCLQWICQIMIILSE